MKTPASITFVGLTVALCIVQAGGFSQTTSTASSPATTFALPALTPRPLPPVDPILTQQLEQLVKAAKLDGITTAGDNADNEDEWSSICVIDTSTSSPRMAGWKMDNFVSPASSY